MDENNILEGVQDAVDNEDLQAPIAEAAEEENVAAEPTEAAAENAESEDEDAKDYTDEEAEPIVGEMTESDYEPIYGEEELLSEQAPKKKANVGLIVGGIVLGVIVILLGAYLLLSAIGIDVPAMLGYNKYNHMGYADVSGMTLGDMCDQLGVSVDEFKERYELPEDMPADTNFNAAYYMMPTKIIAAMSMTDFATLKETYKIPDMTTLGKSVEITEDTPWGLVFDEMTLNDYVGEEYMDEFREEFGFGEDITLETKVGEVRKTMEKAQIEERKKQEKEAEDADEDEVIDEEAEEIDDIEANDAEAELEADENE